MILTWDLDGITDLSHADESIKSLIRVLSIHYYRPALQAQLQELQMLGKRDRLLIETAPYGGIQRVAILLAIREVDEPCRAGGVAYTFEELGRILHPTFTPQPVVLEGDKRLQQLKLELPHVAVSQAIVKYLTRRGCVRVRSKGGAYFIRARIIDDVERVLKSLEECGARFNRIPVDRGSKILLEIAQDAVKAFDQAMKELTEKLKSTKREKVKERALRELKELQEWYDEYLQILHEMRAEFNTATVESEVAFEALEQIVI